MKIYPSIDLLDGHCVRLEQGRFGDKCEYSASALAIAQRYRAAGAKYLHVVDLSGARDGGTRQTELILELIKDSDLAVQVGGGVRSAADVQVLLDGGCERVVIGSLAVRDPETTEQLLRQFGAKHISLALDVRIDPQGVPRTASHGWKEADGPSMWELLQRYVDAELDTILCTDIARDGMLNGPNLELYRALGEKVAEVKVQASGGVSGLDDLRQLRALGVDSVIVGKALYEERFSLEDALAC